MSKHTIFSILVWLLLSFTAFVMLTSTISVSAQTIKVPQDYATIQAAIDAAKRRDVIEVSAGIYYENLIVDQEITLIGADKATTIIDGRNLGNVIHVQADSVTITGFTVRNGNNAIRVMSAIGDVNITGNIIRNGRYGVSLIGDDVTSTTGNIVNDNVFQNNSNVSISIAFGLDNTFSQNDISGSAYGIKMSVTSTTTISDNLLTSNSYGIYMGACEDNSIINNVGIDNSYGIYAVYSDSILIRDNAINGSACGIQLYDTHSSTVLYNNISDNPTTSIYLVHSSTNAVTNNTMSRNDWGFMLYNSSTNTIEGNTISHNTFGITTTLSPSNTIYHNNFINNMDQITRDIQSINTWDQNGEGNHWSDYQGVDDGSGGRVAGDGIGDTLIPHLGADYYPLMNPWPNAERDVAVIGIYESTHTAYVGHIIDFEVVVKNEGPIAETFNVTLQNNVTIIETKTVTNLAPHANTSLIFNWNTSTVSPGYYQISATAEPVPTETDLADNSMTDGTIRVKIQGDVNGDGIVDIFDIGEISAHWYPGPPIGPLGYDTNCDLNLDGAVDIFDLGIVSDHMGETE